MIRNTIHTFRSKCRALVCSLLTLAVFPQFVSGQAKSAMTDKPFDVTRWIETHFAKGKIPPFSFVYDGKPSRETAEKVEIHGRPRRIRRTGGGRILVYVPGSFDRTSG